MHKAGKLRNGAKLIMPNSKPRVVVIDLGFTSIVPLSGSIIRTKTMKSTKVQTLGIPTHVRDISTNDVLCRRLHICGIVMCSCTINALSIWNIG